MLTLCVSQLLFWCVLDTVLINFFPQTFIKLVRCELKLSHHIYLYPKIFFLQIYPTDIVLFLTVVYRMGDENPTSFFFNFFLIKTIANPMHSPIRITIKIDSSENNIDRGRRNGGGS